MGRRTIIVTLLLAGLIAGCGNSASDTVKGPTPVGARVPWLCHPDRMPNPCQRGLETTVLVRDGGRTVERPRAGRRDVDCFFVYPTASGQQRDNAVAEREENVLSTARRHAARLSQHCRVFAPLYRQVTSIGLAKIGTPAGARSGDIAYRDVLAAWNAYRAGPGRGRAAVLFGFSQGAIHLRRLIREQIDGDPAARRGLAGALLIGGNVLVRRGSDRGGDFRTVPLCRAPGQAGCVVAFSTWVTDPPPDTVFGAQGPFSDPWDAGFPTGDAYEVACTDPSRLAADPAPLRPLTDGDDTPFVVTPERFRARCERFGDAHVLRLRPLPGTPPLDSDRTWGTHGYDIALTAEKLAEIVRRMGLAQR